MSGIKPGDIIVKVDGQPVASVRDTQVLTFGPDATRVEVTVLRDGKEMAFKLVRNAYSQIYGSGGVGAEQAQGPYPEEAPTVYMYPMEKRPLVTVTMTDGSVIEAYLVGESETKYHFAKEKEATIPTSGVLKSTVVSIKAKTVQ